MNVLVVGADSGIGNALLEAIPNSIGTSRRPDSKYLKLDVVDDSTYPTFDTKFDTIYYCIGIAGRFGTAEEVMCVNAIKSLDCIEHLAKYIVDNGNIRIMSSVAGSLGITKKFPMKATHTSYCMSKTALNMGIVKLHHNYPNINWQLLHPGLVLTKMTEGIVLTDPKYVHISPQKSAELILQTPMVGRLSFINVVTGHEIPW